MVYVPTWIDMPLLLVAFVMTSIQHRQVTPRYGPVLNLRFGLLVVCCIVMLLTALMNRRAGWMSMGLFLAALACLLAAWQLQRRMPVKRRD